MSFKLNGTLLQWAVETAVMSFEPLFLKKHFHRVRMLV